MADFEQYDSGQHASAPSAYEQSPVVVAPIPTPSTIFSPEADALADQLGYRSADICPKQGELSAQQTQSPPVIRSVEAKQHLTVECPSFWSVQRKGAAYAVCALRAAQAGMDVENIPTDEVTDSTRWSRIWCPFISLGGVAVSESADAVVDVTVTTQKSVP